MTVKDMGWAGAGGEGRGEERGGAEAGEGGGEGRERRRREGWEGRGEGRRVLKLSTQTVGVEHPTNREQDCIS